MRYDVTYRAPDRDPRRRDYRGARLTFGSDRSWFEMPIDVVVMLTGIESDAGAPVPVPVTVNVHAAVVEGVVGAELAVTVTFCGKVPSPARTRWSAPATQLFAIE